MPNPSAVSPGLVLLSSLLVAVSSCGPAGDELATASPELELAEPRACPDLAGLELEDAEVARAEVVPAGGFEAPEEASPSLLRVDFGTLPAFCRVEVVVSPVPTSRIGFEVWLPEEGWNGGFVGVGDGGLVGAILHADMAKPLARGYAVANTDGGHLGGDADTSFALERPESLVDHAWRAVHLMTTLSKEIVRARYGRDVERSIWDGCSTGGRQGLKEAQRFPQDYDGVIAGAPANDWVPLMLHALQVQQRMTDPEGAIATAKLRLLGAAATAACDADDGVEDGIIGRPRECAFDPADLACDGAPGDDCLEPHEVAAVRTIRGGIVDASTGEQVFPGPEVGGEREWFAFQPGVFPIGENYVRDLLFPEREWDLQGFDVGAAVREALSRDTVDIAAVDPDLGPFVASGGRLLLWHGWMDGLIPAGSSLAYHDAVVETLGPETADEAVRLYMIPGLGHCFGGPGIYGVDWLDVMEEWLASGEAPDRLVASRSLEEGGERTRPLCPHPQMAIYRGAGDVDDAASWECGVPE